MQKDFLVPEGRGGGGPEKKFLISVEVNCRKYVFTPKILIGTFSRKKTF